VTEVDPPYRLMGLALLPRGEAGVHDWVKRAPDRSVLDGRTREAAQYGGIFAKTLLPLARRVEPRQRRRVGSIFREQAVLIAPTTAMPPLPIGAAAGLSAWATQRLISAACPYAWPWNVLGWPAVSVPAGLTAEGLPFGLQLVGPANSEPRLLSLAAQLEAVERWHERSPGHVASLATAT
jgi:amidase